MRARCWCLGWIFFLVGVAGAQEDTPGQEFEGVPREDMQEVLAAFAEAGLEGDLVAGDDQTGRGISPWWAGRLSFWNLFQGGENQWQARARVQARGLVVRAKVRPGKAEASTAALAVGYAGEKLKVQVGGLGLTAGYGLLLSDPGRSGGLAAGASWSHPRVRLRGWSSSPEPRSVFGGGFQFSRGRWRLTAAQGAPGQDRPGGGYTAVVLEREREASSWALAGVQAQGGLSGVSFSGNLEKAGGHLGWEISGRREGPQAPWAQAWMVCGRWEPWRRFRAEVQVAGNTSEEGPWTGQRPAVLKTWGGQGWAVHVKAPLSGQGMVALLLAQSRGDRLQSVARRHARDTAELLVRWRPIRGWTLKLRARSRRDRQWEWPAEHPWLPALLTGDNPQRSVLAQLERRAGPAGWRLAWRRLQKGHGAQRLGRSLLEWKGNRMLGHGLRATLHQMWSWGQNVDLVTAITPVPGMVRPRHWGRWQAETVLSLERARGKLVLAVGLSRRLAAAHTEDEDEVSIWLHGKVFW